ncbi:hypothetical protein ACLB2K_074849 [Fragaria x ananassa]
MWDYRVAGLHYGIHSLIATSKRRSEYYSGFPSTLEDSFSSNNTNGAILNSTISTSSGANQGEKVHWTIGCSCSSAASAEIFGDVQLLAAESLENELALVGGAPPAGEGEADENNEGDASQEEVEESEPARPISGIFENSVMHRRYLIVLVLEAHG